MSNNSVNSSFMGPSYPYYKYIRTPKQLGMSSKGNNIGNNIGGLISYIELLVTGETRASATGGPLGDKFFLKTIAKCHDIKTNNTVNRSIYINNIPDGNIPFISSGLGGVSFSSFKGLIPGVMGNIGNLNPLNLFKGFTNGGNPKCQALTMETRDENNVVSEETNYVLINDIEDMPACWFKNKRNPITGKNCIEAFNNIDTTLLDDNENLYSKLYYLSLVLFSMYLVKLYLKK